MKWVMRDIEDFANVDGAVLDCIGELISEEIGPNDRGVTLGKAVRGDPDALLIVSRCALNYIYGQAIAEPPSNFKRFCINALHQYFLKGWRRPLPDEFIFLLGRLMYRSEHKSSRINSHQEVVFLAAYTARRMTDANNPTEEPSKLELAKALCFLRGQGVPDNLRKEISLSGWGDMIEHGVREPIVAERELIEGYINYANAHLRPSKNQFSQINYETIRNTVLRMKRNVDFGQ